MCRTRSSSRSSRNLSHVFFFFLKRDGVKKKLMLRFFRDGRVVVGPCRRRWLSPDAQAWRFAFGRRTHQANAPLALRGASSPARRLTAAHPRTRLGFPL